jgi:hypothetical protein
MLLLWVDSETYLKVVRGRDELLHLLASEDIGGGKMALGVTVLSSLGRGDFDDLRVRKGVRMRGPSLKNLKPYGSRERCFADVEHSNDVLRRG